MEHCIFQRKIDLFLKNSKICAAQVCVPSNNSVVSGKLLLLEITAAVKNFGRIHACQTKTTKFTFNANSANTWLVCRKTPSSTKKLQI